MSKTSLNDQYLARKAEIETAQAAVKTAQEQARGILRQILTASGKGPHEFGGKQCIIVDRNGTLCLMPALRPKVAKKASEPKEPKAAAPKAKKAGKKAKEEAEITV